MVAQDILNGYSIVLASNSIRRHKLLKDMGLSFSIVKKDLEEIYPSDLDIRKVPEYLAELKASHFERDIKESEIIITADTVVILEDEILGKPKDDRQAKVMLEKLSAKTHDVITGVCLVSKKKNKLTFSENTRVTFRSLSCREIDFYIEQWKPFDKSGAYGIQEWLGLIGIERIEGTQSNVLGLPVNTLYKRLKEFSM
ncbi:Maf family nucleotide pyrophosphatase [Ichthyobacterium seriolicida]|uniref:dTTP/UTP pyrophosphatase n=1 Tax=Ichthyobacterium seriolicida TaxID=242600 RepID=A0A1J1DZW1_9FLAO|nr:Maf family nucleotide pyrophosphatase [Ichthyobacterium seriolicida]BAV95471.1 septum formation protein Maf [Ichthyobacterium seriolicida]